MEFVPLDGQFGKLLVGHLEARGIFVQLGTNVEPLIGGRAANQIDHDLAADQRTPAPIVGDMAEHPMFDLVPLAGSRRHMTDLDYQVQLVGQLLQLQAPQANPVAVAAAALGRNQQTAGVWIARMAHFPPPAPNAFDGEFGRVVIDPNAHPALIGSDIVDPVGRHLAEFRIDEPRPPPKDATSPRRAVRRALGIWPQSSPHRPYPKTAGIIRIVQVISAGAMLPIVVEPTKRVFLSLVSGGRAVSERQSQSDFDAPGDVGRWS